MLTYFPQDYTNISHCFTPFLLFLVLLGIISFLFKFFFMALAFSLFFRLQLNPGVSFCFSQLHFTWLLATICLLSVSVLHHPLFLSSFHVSYSEENVGSCVVNVINVHSQFGLTRPSKSTLRLKLPNLAVFVDQISWVIVKSLCH